MVTIFLIKKFNGHISWSLFIKSMVFWTSKRLWVLTSNQNKHIEWNTTVLRLFEHDRLSMLQSRVRGGTLLHKVPKKDTCKWNTTKTWRRHYQPCTGVPNKQEMQTISTMNCWTCLWSWFARFVWLLNDKKVHLMADN